MNILTQIFDWLLAASARASLLTVVVLIAQAVLRHRVPARWLYALWLPVLLVLLVPTFPESPWSVASIIQTAPEPLTVDSIIEQRATLPVLTSSVPTMALPKPINWQQAMLIAWLIGAASVLAVGAGSFASSLCQIKRTRLPVSDAWLHELTRLASEIGLRRAPQVWMASAIRGPAVTGFLHPTLLLPVHFDETLTPQEARLVLKHELTHIKRGDLPLNALLCILLALHWFNPLLWLAFIRARLDREAACDAQVLDSQNQAQRVAYGHTLLKVETAFSHHGLSLGFVGIIQRGTALRTRIRSIANQPKSHNLMKTILTLSIVLLTFFGITSAQQPVTASAASPSSIQVKLDSIILPNVEFHEATAKEAVDYLRAISIKLDTATQDPDLKGVNFVSKLELSAADLKITLSLKNVTLGQATKYVAELSGCKVSVQPSAVVLLAPAEYEAAQKLAATPVDQRFILPSVVFVGGTLAEAVEFVRVKSLALDPAKHGLNIILKPGFDATAKLSLSLKNAPASEVLRYCAEMTMHKLTLDDDIFIIAP